MQRAQTIINNFKNIFKDIPYTEEELFEISSNTKGDNISTFNYLVNFLLKKYNRQPTSIIKQIVKDVADMYNIKCQYQITSENQDTSVAKFNINNMNYIVVYNTEITIKKLVYNFKIADFI